MSIEYEYRRGDGKLHRIDGPARRFSDGYEDWYLNGKLHREGGPAVIYSDGHREWRLDGIQLTLTEELKISHPVLYDQMLVYEVLRK